jgi:hypothetical protein
MRLFLCLIFSYKNYNNNWEWRWRGGIRVQEVWNKNGDLLRWKAMQLLFFILYSCFLIKIIITGVKVERGGKAKQQSHFFVY